MPEEEAEYNHVRFTITGVVKTEETAAGEQELWNEGAYGVADLVEIAEDLSVTFEGVTE